MRKHIGLFALAALIAGDLAAGAADSDYRNIQLQKDERDILQLHGQWNRALLSADTAALQRILAPDYTMIDPAGKAATKAQEIAMYASGDLKFDSLQTSEQRVRIYQGGAVVSGKATIKGKHKGEDISGDYYFVDVFEWKRVAGGGWHAVFTQLTKVETDKDKKDNKKDPKPAQQ